jgi:hypothetical protein
MDTGMSESRIVTFCIKVLPRKLAEFIMISNPKVTDELRALLLQSEKFNSIYPELAITSPSIRTLENES